MNDSRQLFLSGLVSEDRGVNNDTHYATTPCQASELLGALDLKEGIAERLQDPGAPRIELDCSVLAELVEPADQMRAAVPVRLPDAFAAGQSRRQFLAQ